MRDKSIKKHKSTADKAANLGRNCSSGIPRCVQAPAEHNTSAELTIWRQSGRSNVRAWSSTKAETNQIALPVPSIG